VQNKLRIGGVPEHFNLPWKLAIADDAFAATGVDVEFIDYPGGTGAMNTALRNGDLDAALVLTEGAVLDILGGSDNRLVSTYVDSPLIWGIHVAACSDIHDVADIKGKRFAISRYGSGSHLIAAVDAAERGFPTDALQFVVVGDIDGARAALANHDADVFLWEKHMTQALVDSGEFRRVGERVVPWPAFVVSVRTDYLDVHQSTISSVLEIVAGYAAQLQSGSKSAELVSESYGISVADAQSWLSGVKWNEDRRYPAAAMARVVNALGSQGLIESSDIERDDIWREL
jgi:ABC-type nitrate/sulfonate/bicarbonate transport system substrate-binding protein